MRIHFRANLIREWMRITRNARLLREDPDRKKKSKRFAPIAILYALLAAACGCALLLFTMLGHAGLVETVLIVCGGVAIGGFAALISLITAMIYWACLLSLDRGALTWVTLALILAILGGAAAFIAIMF